MGYVVLDSTAKTGSLFWPLSLLGMIIKKGWWLLKTR